MKNILIEIPRREVEESVGEATAHIGAREDARSQGEGVGRLATLGEDSRMLSRFLADAAAHATERLKGHVVSSSYSGTMLRIELETSGAYDEAMTPMLESSLKEYFPAAVTARWVRLSGFPGADEWHAQAEAKLAEAERSLCHRSRPRRPAVKNEAG